MSKSTTLPYISHDGLSLFLEWPTYALRFPFNEAGLSKALKHIPQMSGATTVPLRQGNIPSREIPATGKIAKIAPTTARKREAKSFTEEQKLAAMDIVRKLRLT